MSRMNVVILGAGLAGNDCRPPLSDRTSSSWNDASRRRPHSLRAADGYLVQPGRAVHLVIHGHSNSVTTWAWMLDAAGAKAAILDARRLVRASNPYTLLMKMPMSPLEKLDFGRTIMRLRRLEAQESKLDAKRLDDSP